MLPKPSSKQLEAIEAPVGPVLVVAGPGAGKTFCLIQRAEYLVAKAGMLPARLCAVTFTNKAAEEIGSRLKRQFGAVGGEITCGTLHGLCLDFLREFGGRIGIPRGFGIADDEYQRAVLRRLGVPRKEMYQALVLFGRRRLQDYTLSERDERIFREYLSDLRHRSMLDFDDIIGLTRKLFLKQPDVATTLRSRWDYVLVDEFQDLSTAQYEIVASLGKDHRGVFAVGDDEQSIFSWAGADPMVLVRFRDEFAIKDPILLDKNRRCSRQIFAVARRLLTANLTLFDKRIEADREGDFDVVARSFPDDRTELQWLVEDIRRDQTNEPRSWGEYAVLYRRHKTGTEIEKRFIREDMPCRLAKGQALMDDPVISYAVDSLRVMKFPGNPVVLDTFAERVLPGHLLDRARALVPDQDDLLNAMRTYARQQGRHDPDTKKAWRFIYHVENLHALRKTHNTLGALVEDLLAQRVGRYRNPLEEVAEDLTDPATYPGAQQLAEEIGHTQEAGSQLAIAEAGGMGFAIRGMLAAAGVNAKTFKQAPEDSEKTFWSAEKVGAATFPVLLFKALQFLQSKDSSDSLREYVTFDLETTDKDVSDCEIVEIGAARVRDGRVTHEFQTLVRCEKPIAPQATKVHGYTNDDLRDAPAFAEVWAQFRAFVGDDILVAHNAQQFDVPVLKRAADGLAGIEKLVFFDTLPLAKSLFRESVKLEHLAERFEVPKGRSHHALDDAIALAHVTEKLRQLRTTRSRKAMLTNALDYIGLAFALLPELPKDGDGAVLLDSARPHTLGRFSDCLTSYEVERDTRLDSNAPTLDDIIKRLGGKRLMERLRSERSASERYPAAMGRLNALIDASVAASLKDSLTLFLERVTLSSSEGVEIDPHRLNLLTLHSTKGLEFSRVYIVGVEDHQLPGYYETIEEREEETQEARRLLYVGMTRAKDRLVLTRTDERFGQSTGGSRFLDEMDLKAT